MGGRLGAALFLLIFAVAFGGVGVFATWTIGSTFSEAWKAREWVRVRASVGDATLHSSGDTFRAEGTYRYTFEGREYSGSRLGLSQLGGSDNIDDWHQEVSAQLAEAREARRPITVWVNPDDPSQAVYDRDIRWGEILFMTPFSLAFGGVGVGAFIAMVAVLLGKGSGMASPQGAREAAQAVGPGTDGGGKGAGFLWVFAFFWNAMAWPIALLAIPQIIAEGQWVGLFVILFPLVGLGLLWGAAAASWNAWKSRRGAKSPGGATATGSLTAARSLPGTMAARAARAMFNPPDGAVRGGFGRTPVREIPIPSSLASVEEGGGAMTLRYSSRRWLGMAIVVFVIGGIVTAIGALMMAKEGFGFAPLITILVGSAIDVAFVAILTSRLEVTVRQGRLEVRKRSLFGSRQWDLARSEVTALRPSISHRINDYPYYTLSAVTAAGEQVPVGSSIRGPELTDSLARRIARVFGLPASGAVPAGTVTE